MLLRAKNDTYSHIYIYIGYQLRSTEIRNKIHPMIRVLISDLLFKLILTERYHELGV